MNQAELVEMKEDRLANTAVVAFLGALLMGQSWQIWESPKGTVKILMLTVPNYTELVIFAIVSSLFTLSLLLATTSIVTPIRCWGLRNYLKILTHKYIGWFLG